MPEWQSKAKLWKGGSLQISDVDFPASAGRGQNQTTNRAAQMVDWLRRSAQKQLALRLLTEFCHCHLA